MIISLRYAIAYSQLVALIVKAKQVGQSDRILSFQFFTKTHHLIVAIRKLIASDLLFGRDFRR